MTRTPVPFILLLSLASATPTGSFAQEAAFGGGLPGGDSGMPSLMNTTTHHRPHRAPAPPAAAPAADQLDADQSGSAEPPPAAPSRPARSARSRAASRALPAGDPAELSADRPDEATRTASAPTTQPATPAPEIASPGPANPAPAPLPMPTYQPMSPVLPRQPAQAQPPAMRPAPAQSAAVAPPRVLGGMRSLTLETGMGRVVELGGSASTVFAADPKVAEVRPASANSLFIFGVGAGRTSVAALDGSGHPVAQYDVIVQPSSYGAIAARGAIARAMPGANIKISTESGNVQVSGEVATAADAQHVMDIVKGYTPANVTTVNNLNVTSAIQVNLRVRIAEMGRSLTRDLGFNWSALGTLGKYAAIGFTSSNPLVSAATAGAASALGSTSAGSSPNIQTGYHFPTANSPASASNINPVIDALQQDQLIHMLAEPNLTALSGQTASFLVGGEFPIPVAQQNNTVTIEFKQFGVSLAFVPTVMSDGHISLKVRPEVSALSSNGAIQLSASNASIQIPALSVRRAETTVELGSGQSFAIAGLLQDNATLTGNSVPFLGDLPILGALFRSDNFQRNETELVIIVTPYIVRPVTEQAQLTTPLEGNKLPNDFERMLMLRQKSFDAHGADAAAVPPRVPGNAGFVVQ